MKLNLRSVDLNLLTVFDALMCEQHLSRAAQRLGMSQPAVSAALQRLRLTLKDELFVRSRQGMMPTPRARTLHPPLQQALAQISEALSGGDDFDPARSERQFRLLADSYLEITGLGQLLSTLRAAGPGLGLIAEPVAERDPLAALRRLEVDVVLDYVRLDAERVEAEELAREELVVIARRDHPRIGDSLSLEQYLAEGHAVLPPRSREQRPLELALGGRALPRRAEATVHHFSAMPAVVAQTDYLATMPRALALILAQAFAVKCLPFPLPVAPVSIWMMWPAVLNADAGHRWLRDRLRELTVDYA